MKTAILITDCIERLLELIAAGETNDLGLAAEQVGSLGGLDEQEQAVADATITLLLWRSNED